MKGSVGMWSGSYYAVPFSLQTAYAGCRIFLFAVVLIKAEPFGRAQGHIGIYGIGIPVLDDVHILYPETIAGAQHGTGIMRLVDVFQGNGDMTGAEADDLVKLFFPVLRNKLREVGDQVTAHPA